MISVAPGFTLARTKASIDLAELSAITARRSRPERVSRYFPPLRRGLGSACAAINHLDRTRDEDFAAAPGSKGVAGAEGNFRLIHLDDAFEKIAVGIDHRAPQLREQPGRLVGDAELVFQLSRRHTVGVRRHHVRGPEPRRQRQFRPMHHRAGGSASVRRPQSRHSEKPRAALQSDSAPLPHVGQTNPFGQRRQTKMSRNATVGKLLLKLRERPPTRHRSLLPRQTAPPQTRPRSDTTYSGT